MSNPDAYFDSLSLGERLTEIVDGAALQEIHLLAYAACLLSLYEGKPTAEWGYEFASTENGLPFSTEVDDAIEVGLGLGLMTRAGPLLKVTSEGRAEVTGLRQMQRSKVRDRYLGGAADALLVLNPGNLREAFNYEPAISYLRTGNRTDWLLTAPVVERLYENFKQLRAALAYDAHDLSVPLVSWLKYLIQVGRSEPHASRAD